MLPTGTGGCGNHRCDKRRTPFSGVRNTRERERAGDLSTISNHRLGGTLAKGCDRIALYSPKITSVFYVYKRMDCRWSL
jgi:hypothetical protein